MGTLLRVPGKKVCRISLFRKRSQQQTETCCHSLPFSLLGLFASPFFSASTNCSFSAVHTITELLLTHSSLLHSGYFSDRQIHHSNQNSEYGRQIQPYRRKQTGKRMERKPTVRIHIPPSIQVPDLGLPFLCSLIPVYKNRSIRASWSVNFHFYHCNSNRSSTRAVCGMGGLLISASSEWHPSQERSTVQPVHLVLSEQREQSEKMR